MKQKTWDDCVQALRDERARLEAAPEWIDHVERATAFARVLSWLEKQKPVRRPARSVRI